MKKIHYLSRITYLLGVALLLAGILVTYINVPAIAQDSIETPEVPTGEIVEEPPTEPSEEPLVEVSEEPPVEASQEPPLESSEVPLEEPIVESSVEPPLGETQEPLPVETIEPTQQEVPVEALTSTEELFPSQESPEMMLMSASVGDEATSDDPDYDPTEFGLPDPGDQGFLNNECDKPENDCDKEEGNVASGGTYLYTPDVVVIKAGNTEFIYTPDGPDCNTAVGGDPYCVEFQDNQVIVTRNECYDTNPSGGCVPAQDISNIQFWNVGGPTETPEAPTETPEIPTSTPDPRTPSPTPDHKKPTKTPGPDDTEEPTTLATLAPPSGGGGQILAPVTGADFGRIGFESNLLQKIFVSLGVFLLGITVVLDNFGRKRR